MFSIFFSISLPIRGLASSKNTPFSTLMDTPLDGQRVGFPAHKDPITVVLVPTKCLDEK